MNHITALKRNMEPGHGENAIKFNVVVAYRLQSFYVQSFRLARA